MLTKPLPAVTAVLEDQNKMTENKSTLVLFTFNLATTS